MGEGENGNSLRERQLVARTATRCENGNPLQNGNLLQNGNPLLTVEAIHVGYGKMDVLHDVTLVIHPGEVVAIIGPNGAGKSTVIKSVVGLLKPSAGRILFDGEEITALKPHLIERVMLLFPRLAERRKQLAGTMSGGEQQMLAIARALMSRPKLLLLDEPSMGLAPVLVEAIFNIIEEINKEGTTILLVEQNAHMALQVASRGYVLQTGEIVLSDSAINLQKDPMVQKAYLGME
jgi:branched-chain amino acid transport system ATP-binding protein